MDRCKVETQFMKMIINRIFYNNGMFVNFPDYLLSLNAKISCNSSQCNFLFFFDFLIKRQQEIGSVFNFQKHFFVLECLRGCWCFFSRFHLPFILRFPYRAEHMATLELSKSFILSQLRKLFKLNDTGKVMAA